MISLSSAKRVAFASVLFVAPLLAAEEGAGGAEKPSMLIWQWLNFALLAGILGWLISKQVGPLLVARSKEIGDGLKAGEKAKAEADARAAQVHSQLANLDKEIATLRTSAHEELEREAARIRRDTATEISRIRSQAEMEIESSGKMARLEVQRFAAKLAIDLAEQKVRTRMSPDVQAGLLDAFLHDLPAGQAEVNR